MKSVGALLILSILIFMILLVAINTKLTFSTLGQSNVPLPVDMNSMSLLILVGAFVILLIFLDVRKRRR